MWRNEHRLGVLILGEQSERVAIDRKTHTYGPTRPHTPSQSERKQRGKLVPDVAAVVGGWAMSSPAGVVRSIGDVIPPPEDERLARCAEASAAMVRWDDELERADGQKRTSAYRRVAVKRVLLPDGVDDPRLRVSRAAPWIPIVRGIPIRPPVWARDLGSVLGRFFWFLL